MDKKFVYFFGNGVADGKADMKNLLGGKGANLAEMTSLNIPVPAGFTITTEVCTEYYENNQQWPAGLEAQITEALVKVEAAMGAKFADLNNPLLLSVRSGARVSMPGMMDTILNLGLNETTIAGLEAKNPRFAWDSYRRFIQMYGGVVLDLEHHDFEHILDAVKGEKGVKLDTDLDTDDLKEVVKRYKAMVAEKTGSEFPSDPKEQLSGAINAVFRSWMNPRAIYYRKMNEIPEHWGTAVNVQAMVFGNMGETSGTGVAFTRNPSTGENVFYGEYLMNAQGEDVVAGIRTPQPIAQLEQTNKQAYEQLCNIYKTLEKHYKDMQDIEFTIQEGVLYMLQTRNGKRTGPAAVKIAVDMASENLITKADAILRVAPEQLDQLLHPMVDPKAKLTKVAKGLPASPGAAVGTIVFNAEDAAQAVAANPKAKVILVRTETSPEDIGGMDAAQGILTSRGGMTSHAAVVARGMGKCCVAGCGDALVNEKAKTLTIGEHVLHEGDWLTLNGTTGDIILGETKLIEPELSGDFATLMSLADDVRALKVRTNADTPHDAKVARDFGAEGIGLCRTEHMFFAEDRILAVREMILADNEEDRRKALDKLLPFQKADFIGIFEAMKDLPVTIRLLDPPLHEFLPHEPAAITSVANELGVTEEHLIAKVESLAEFNPMLGFRGCRLGIVFPEIFEMQVRAIFEAACELAKNKGFKIVPEVMIPLVGTTKEFDIIRDYSEKVAKETMEKYGVNLEYLIGTMIEVPRACVISDKIAEGAEFFSFGTNDLTQMTFGYSRDDAGKFLPTFVDKGILEKDPFQALDQEGVGQLIALSVEKGRATRPDLKVGICGEHGGEPSSIAFCHKVGLDYVSCSPYRVPIARLAAAQIELKSPRKGGEAVKSDYSTK